MTNGSAERETGSAGILVTFRESPLPVKAILAGILVNKLGAFMQVFLLLFLVHRGFSEVQAGTSLGGYGLGSVAGVLLGGWFADRIGVRRTIVISMAGTAVLLLAVLYVSFYPAILGAVIAVGAASQVYRPASATLLAELTPHDRQLMVFAMSRLALNVGTTAAPLIGVLLINVSYNLLFWCEAAAALGYAAIALFVLPRNDPRPAAAARAGSNADMEVRAADRRAGYLALTADPRYLLFLLAQLIIAAVYVQYLGTLPLAMKAAGVQTLWYGAMVALNSLIVISFELLVTKVVQRLPARLVVTAGFALTGSGLAVYALPGGLAVFVIGTLMWSLAEVVLGPIMSTYPAQAGPPELRGRYIAAAQSMYGIGSTLGPIVGVTLWVTLGRPVWVILGTVALVAIVPAWYGIRPSAARRAEEHAPPTFVARAAADMDANS